MYLTTTIGKFSPLHVCHSYPPHSPAHARDRHCDGPRTDADENMTDMTTMTTSPATSEAATTTNVEEDHDHDHDDEDHDDHDDGGEMVTLPPSPTESVGCVPHDDHWHCEGPAITEPVEPTTTAEEAGEATTAPAEVDNAVGLVPPLEMLPAAGLFGIFMLAL